MIVQDTLSWLRQPRHPTC